MLPTASSGGSPAHFDTEGPAIAGVALVLAIAGLAASCVPARLALRIDPTVAHRYE
jgi:ABC-type antimicrobial peptide transport system permease subunit